MASTAWGRPWDRSGIKAGCSSMATSVKVSSLGCLRPALGTKSRSRSRPNDDNKCSACGRVAAFRVLSHGEDAEVTTAWASAGVASRPPRAEVGDRGERNLEAGSSPHAREEPGVDVPKRLSSGIGLVPPVALASATLAYFTGAPSCLAATASNGIYELSALDASSASAVASLLKPAIGLASLFMIVRIVLTWFPETKSKEFPWLLFYYTTEPVLSFTRQVFQPVGGVDISPIIWVAFLSFMNEILVGPQGILILLSNKA